MSAAPLSPAMAPQSQITLVLAGNPNVGKSTIFNILTGARQKVANYPGVTVEKKSGQMVLNNQKIVNVIDLPGTYSLNAQSEDEIIATKIIMGQLANTKRPDLVVVIAEATKLDRGLYLLEQIRATHPHVLFVVNMLDELKSQGLKLDLEKLATLLGVPVVGTTASREHGITNLKNTLNALCTTLPDPDAKSTTPVPTQSTQDTLARHEKIVSQVLIKVAAQNTSLSDKIDLFLLHKFMGPLIFFAVLFLLFQSLFTWATPITDLIDSTFGFLGELADSYIQHQVLKSLVTDGILAGVGSVVVFVPQIALTFLFIGFLDMTGYLARGGFLVDRLMRLVGLEGKAFVPLISSFACAIPGILATRTLQNSRQRLITILIAPLMTCSARLPVYTLVISAFVPATAKILGLPAQGMTLFLLFLLGIFMAMAVALVAKAFEKKRHTSHFVMELPPYRLPTLKNIYYYVSFRTLTFLKTAGSIIFVLSLMLWALAYFPHSTKIAKQFEQQQQGLTASDLPDEQKNIQLAELEQQQAGEYLRTSYMGKLGQFLEPAFAPMGFDWRITIGVLASFAAREVFVSTMGVVFNLGDVNETSQSLVKRLNHAKRIDGTPLYTLATALALLVFFALASQCISTLAVIRRETNSWRWPLISFAYMTLLAYVSATITYQITKQFLG